MSWSTEELISQINNRKNVVVELGCGPNPSDDIIGIDHLELEGVHYVADLEKGLKMIPDKSVDELRSRHFLEHIENFDLLIREIHRILKPGGKHVAVVPHFANPYYYSDYTHKRFFGLYSFDYFSKPEHQLKRKVPAFYDNVKFKVVYRKIIFKAPEFPIRNFFRNRIVQTIFNLSSYMQELYECSFCYRIPPQELEFVMVPEL